MKERKKSKERSIGFNCSMPSTWVDAIDIDCAIKGIDRSKWMRDAAKAKLPVLNNPDELKEWLANNEKNN